jgi:hypothetical protein
MSERSYCIVVCRHCGTEPSIGWTTGGYDAECDCGFQRGAIVTVWVMLDVDEVLALARRES